MMRRTRREALAAAAGALAAAYGLSACGGGQSETGSTLTATWLDPAGTGQLRRGPGEPLLARTELAPASQATRTLATLVHLTDAHVVDASSPARVPFLDRLGPPFQSAFRPQEALTLPVLSAMVGTVRRLRPAAVIQGGDLIDNVQANELAWAMAMLSGGRAEPGPYDGPQQASNPDPFYYRPDLDAPRFPGLLGVASRPLRSPGVARPVYPVLGDHDILVAGELPPSSLTQSLAVGDRALWELPSGLALPPGTQLTTTGSPDGPPLPTQIGRLIAQALAGLTVRVRPSPARRELAAQEVVGRLRGGSAATLDYAVELGPLRLVVLDLARRDGGSGGLVRPDQPGWLAGQLRDTKPTIVVSHQPLEDSAGGETLLAVLDHTPHVIATLSGHTHHNRIAPRAGYWQIQTASLIDYPQQARALRLVETERGLALQTWMLDHTGNPLAAISRQLAYLDAQGGRPGGYAGTHADRNAMLFLR